MAERKIFWIYTYFIRYTDTGHHEVFNTTTEGYCPAGAVIEKELDRVKYGESLPCGEDNPLLKKKPQKKTFWQWIKGA